MRVVRDAEAGLWTVTAPGRSLHTPTVAGHRVYAFVAGRLTALDRASGEVVWQGERRWYDGHGGGLLRWFDGSVRFKASGGQIVIAELLNGPSPRHSRFTVVENESGSPLCSFDVGVVDTNGRYRSDGRTVVVCHRDRSGLAVSAFDGLDGRLLWRHPFRRIESMELAEEVVVVQGQQPHNYAVRAYELRTGDQIWQQSTAEQCELRLPEHGSSPQEPLIYLWNQPHNLLSWYSLATGNTIGQLPFYRRPYDLYPRERELLVLDGGRSVWLSSGRHHVLHARPFEPSTPVTRYDWLRKRLSWPGRSDQPIASADGWLYAIDEERRLRTARVARSGRWHPLRRVRWPDRIPPALRCDKLLGGLVAGHDHVYVRAANRRLGSACAVALRQGRVLWQRRIGGITPPVPTGDQVLILDGHEDHDHLRLVDAETGASADPE